MPVYTDFTLAKYEDGVLTVSMAPPVAVGGWDVRFLVTKHFGGSGILIRRSVSSGYNDASGINVTNSGQGVFAIDLRSTDSSGMAFGNYAYVVERFNSGSRTVLSMGYLILTPNVG